MGLFNWLFGQRKPKSAVTRLSDGTPVESEEEILAMLDAMEREGPARPLLYAFQHKALPQHLFMNHAELLDELEGRCTRPGIMTLLHTRSLAQVMCEDSGLVKSNHEMDEDEDEAAHQAEMELFLPLRIDKASRHGYTVYIITMPTPEQTPEAHYAALVLRDDEPHEHGTPSPSSRYFTLEKSFGAQTVLCEWTTDGSHQNYGAGPPPDRVAFMESVFARLNAV